MSTHIYAYSIKNQWLNMSLYFINFMYNTRKPFKDSKFGKLLKSKTFRYISYALNPLAALFYSPLLVGVEYKLYTVEKKTSFNNDWNTYFTNSTNVCAHITTPDRLQDNSELLGGREKNTKWLANGDYIKTDFILLDKTDIISFFENLDSGFSIRKNQLNSPNNYKRHTTNNGSQNITNQERENDNPQSTNKNYNDIIYFLKGTTGADCIVYTISTNVI